MHRITAVLLLCSALSVSSLTAQPAAHARLAIVVDDHGIGLPEVREGLTKLVAALPGVEIGLFSAARPEWTVQKFTTDTGALEGAIKSLVPMPAPSDLDALVSSVARQLRKDAPERSAILVVNIDNPAPQNRGFQPQFPNPITIDHLRKSGTVFYAIAARHAHPGDHDPLLEAAAEATHGSVDLVVADPNVAASIERMAGVLRGKLQ